MEFEVVDLGLIEYSRALSFQKKTLQDTLAGERSATLITCRHFPVITLGRTASLHNIVAPTEALQARNIKVIETERGGDVTYHGPGQLTIYPIINLNYFKKDIHWYLRTLEEIIIALLSDFGLQADRPNNLTGVWLNDKKICSIGISIKRWITFHGLSINLHHHDLENFRLIRPCGLAKVMTSLETELGRSVEHAIIMQRFSHLFQALTSKFPERQNA